MDGATAGRGGATIHQSVSQQFLAQGHSDMQTGGAGDRTANHPNGDLPPEPRSALSVFRPVGLNVTQPARVKGGAFKAVSPLQKQPHVYKNKTSTLHSNNAALPPILRSLSLTTSHPLGVSRPSFMFKDYLLIQNVQEHETTGKGPVLWGWGGGVGGCMALFVCWLSY